MSKIYRLRPVNETTLDELINNYLWFSLRSGFNDNDDANFESFTVSTPQLLAALEGTYTEKGIEAFIREMEKTGICCFTKELPTDNQRRRFPNGRNSLCVEYDKGILERYLSESIYAIRSPFIDVTYAKNPTIMETSGEYHILIDEDENGKEYAPIISICRDPKEFSRLLKLLLTRIDIKFSQQKESRIIIGGKNTQYLAEGAKGYKVSIPSDAVSKIYLYAEPITNHEKTVIEKLSQSPTLANLIEKLY